MLSRPRSQFFTIRTFQPANNIYIFTLFEIICGKVKLLFSSLLLGQEFIQFLRNSTLYVGCINLQYCAFFHWNQPELSKTLCSQVLAAVLNPSIKIWSKSVNRSFVCYRARHSLSNFYLVMLTKNNYQINISWWLSIADLFTTGIPEFPCICILMANTWKNTTKGQ